MTGPLRVLIAGGGFAGVEVLLALGALAGPRVRITMVSNDDHLVFRPLAVNEPFGLGDLERVALDELCADQGAGLVRGRLTAVDVPARTVMTDATGLLDYDVLVIAVGARRSPSVPGALAFDGRRGSVELRQLVDQLGDGSINALAFTAPADAMWTLPMYELALLTASELQRRGTSGVALSVATPERAPLAIFGTEVAAHVEHLLGDRGIELRRESAPLRIGVSHGRPALLTTAGAVAADRVVALPHVAGPALPGVPADPAGFIPTDPHGVVYGTAGVYAAGDVTAYPMKQGGLATQQADAVAVSIAARAGVPIDPRPFDPRLRALLLTGGAPIELGGSAGGVRELPASAWSDKVRGRHLSAWLAESAGPLSAAS